MYLAGVLEHFLTSKVPYCIQFSTSAETHTSKSDDYTALLRGPDIFRYRFPIKTRRMSTVLLKSCLSLEFQSIFSPLRAFLTFESSALLLFALVLRETWFSLTFQSLCGFTLVLIASKSAFMRPFAASKCMPAQLIYWLSGLHFEIMTQQIANGSHD